jgi:hypothetical protein
MHRMQAIQGGIMKRTAVIALGASALVFASAALAQPNLSSRATPPVSSRNGTMVRAAIAIEANTAKNPQAPGLQRARNRIALNAIKHEANGNGPGPREAGVERPQGVERAERVERPQIALSPSVFERPLPSGLADRPLPAGMADRPLPRGLVERPQPVRARGR